MKFSYSLVLVTVVFVSPINAKSIDNLDLFFAESAIRFTEKWLAPSQLYISLILPNRVPFNTRYLLKLTRKLNQVLKRKVYFRMVKNITKYRNIDPPPNELLWYPFETRHYDNICYFLDDSSFSTVMKKHFLFFERTEKDIELDFRHCKIKFDSNIAVYYPYNKTNFRSEIRFEEIYKIIDDQKSLQKNILGKIELRSNKTNYSGLQSFVWKRRSNLHGTQFSAITETELPFIELPKNLNGSILSFLEWLSFL